VTWNWPANEKVGRTRRKVKKIGIGLKTPFMAELIFEALTDLQKL